MAIHTILHTDSFLISNMFELNTSKFSLSVSEKRVLIENRQRKTNEQTF